MTAERYSPRAGERLYNVREFARALGLRESTGRAWILRRKVGYLKLNGGSIRVPESEILRILEEGFVPARESANGPR